MGIKLSESLKKLKSGDKKLRIFLALGAAAVVIILLSELFPTAKKESAEINKDYTYSDYTASLEKRTQDLIGSIQGAGRCRVMITLKNTNESFYAKNIQESGGDGSYSKSSEYVLYDGQSGDSPVLVKQEFPEIQGVAVVCDGADSTVVRESIINSIAALFDISVSKISVTKYKG